MKQIVECVPNFSEGRRQEVIEAIAAAIRGTAGCSLLDVDAGYSTNRTVYTFVGDPDSVCAGALAAARVARELIDMRRHRGEHPRFGAMDVCPFVPVAGIGMAECAELARRFARLAADELGIPIYLYEAAAEHDYRRTLPALRDGEYEGLARRLQDPRWRPDFGPAEFIPSWGATAVGARRFLLAYNINILGTPNQAHRIALNLREAGRGDQEPGRLKAVKGIGWFVEEYNVAQVSVNLTDYRLTPLHVLFEAVRTEAERLRVGVAGSEIVGLVPLEAMLMAADYYIDRENLFVYEEDQKLRLVIDRLGLSSISPFVAGEKIIDYLIREEPVEPLASMPLRGFIEEVAARSSAPGGGSVSAVMAAVGVGLGAMVAKLTHGVRKFDAVRAQMEALIPVFHELTRELIPQVDADTSAFNEYLAGVKMPKDTDEERRARGARMQAGLKTAIEVPLTTMRLGDRAWDGFRELARHGNPASASDTGVGARALDAGIWGAHQNVLINLRDMEDEIYKAATTAEADRLAARSGRMCAEVLAILETGRGDGTA